MIKVVGSDEVATRDSEPDPAYAGAILTTTATSAQLYAWYADWLTARGYQPVTYYRMADQTSGVAWRAPGGREQVQIGVFDAAELAAQQHVTVAERAGTLIYEEVLVGYRVRPLDVEACRPLRWTVIDKPAPATGRSRMVWRLCAAKQRPIRSAVVAARPRHR